MLKTKDKIITFLKNATTVKLTLHKRLDIEVKFATWMDFGLGIHRHYRAVHVYFIFWELYILWRAKEREVKMAERHRFEEDAYVFNNLLVPNMKSIGNFISQKLKKTSADVKLKNAHIEGMGTGIYGRTYFKNRIGGYLRIDFWVDVPPKKTMQEMVKKSNFY